MSILELPVIGSRQNNIEKIYSLLSDQPLRNFEGMDLGILKLEDDSQVYFYFFSQDNDNYHYLWDLVIPHAIGCILLFDWQDPQSIERNLRTLEYLEERFTTPLHICSLPAENDIPDDLIREELEAKGTRFLHTFDPASKESAKEILLQVISR
jgi:signal recognition particle receptor subunit beta